MSFIKNFLEWFKLKPKLDQNNLKPRFVKEAEIWWCKIGENIGTEISGKGEKFTIPCIIYKKLSSYSFVVIPCSTQIKDGDWFVKLIQKKKEMVACLHQIKMIDYRRLDNKVGTLDDTDFAKVVVGFENLYNKNASK